MPVVNDYTALLSGSYWNGIEVTDAPVIVTYSFPTSLPSYDASIGGFTAATDASFQAFTSTEQTQAITALGEWSAASGLIFIQVAPGEGDINFQNIDFNTTSSPSYAGYGGIGFYPFGDWSNLSYPNFTSDLDSSGDVFMNSQFLNNGTINYGTLLHEIGHAIGLKHPTEVVTDYAAEPTPVVHDQVLSSDDPSLTIMATVADGSGADSHLQQLDKNAAAFIYGAAGTGGVYTTSASGTNAVSSWSWDATTQTLTQTALSTNETVRGTSVNDVIHGLSGDRLFALDGTDVLYGGGGNDSLYGGPGTDTLIGGAGGNSFYVSSATTTITETNVGSSDTVYSTFSFALPANVDTLYLYGQGLTGTANNAGDTLYGDGTYGTTLIGGAGSDYIVGGAGNDTIEGGGGPDLMYGEAGDNTFVFKALADAPVGATLTTIGDFFEGQDKIDLSYIKTTGGSDPGQPLTFIGTNPFSDNAGELRQVTSGGNTIVEGDVNGDGNPDFEIQLNGTFTLQASDFVLAPACFRTGTRIQTDKGEVAVEDLSIGDRVMTHSADARAVRWIGHRRIDCSRHPDPRSVWPVRVRAGAFGDNLPRRDLWLSPDHAAFVDDVLIPVRYLVNGRTIVQYGHESVEYWHVELAQHSVIYAEGLAAESYLDTGNRGAFANGGPVLDLHPDFARQVWETRSCALLVLAGPLVCAARRRLLARATALGHRVTRDPGLRVFAGGVALAAEQHGQVWRIRLPDATTEVRLVSRVWHPAHMRPPSDDARALGVALSRLWLDGEEVGLDGPHMSHGWHAREPGWRWTNGDARLTVSRALAFQVTLTGSYWLDEDIAERLHGVPQDSAKMRAAQVA